MPSAPRQNMAQVVRVGQLVLGVVDNEPLGLHWGAAGFMAAALHLQQANTTAGAAMRREPSRPLVGLNTSSVAL